MNVKLLAKAVLSDDYSGWTAFHFRKFYNLFKMVQHVGFELEIQDLSLSIKQAACLLQYGFSFSGQSKSDDNILKKDFKSKSIRAIKSKIAEESYYLHQHDEKELILLYSFDVEKTNPNIKDIKGILNTFKSQTENTINFLLKQGIDLSGGWHWNYEITSLELNDNLTKFSNYGLLSQLMAHGYFLSNNLKNDKINYKKLHFSEQVNSSATDKDGNFTNNKHVATLTIPSFDGKTYVWHLHSIPKTKKLRVENKAALPCFHNSLILINVFAGILFLTGNDFITFINECEKILRVNKDEYVKLLFKIKK